MAEKCVNCGTIRGDCQTVTAGPLCALCRRIAHRVEEKIFVGNVVFTRVLRDEPENRFESQAVATERGGKHGKRD